MRKIAVALFSVPLLVLALAGCTGPAPVEPEPSQSATETPAEPAPSQSNEAATVIISVASVEVLGADGQTIAEFGYFDPDAAVAVDVLTAAFGAEPEVTQSGQTNHFPATTNSNWSGFELIDHEADTRYPDLPNFTVRTFVEQSGGVAIQTTDGVYVGMAGAEVEQLSYRNWIDEGTGTPIAIYLLEQSPVQIDATPDYEPAALSVSVMATSPDGVVERIAAPGANWGA